MIKITKISRVGLLSMGAILAVFFVSLVTTPKTHAAITSSLGLGSTGGQVTELQQFLATNPKIYPQGIVSGYYGGLTKAAVVQFQTAYDIAQVGVVGPTTGAKINQIEASGLGLDTSAPVIYNLAVQTNSSGATVNWSTSELAKGQVFYDTAPIQSTEATMHAQAPYLSGVSASNSSVSLSQSISLSNLQSNTLYYYVVQSVDSSGNVSVTQTNTFHTN